MSSPVQKPSRLRETVVAEHGGKSSQAHDAPKSPEVPKSPKQQEAHSKSDTTSTSTSSSSSSSSSSSKSHGLANIDTSAASGKATSGDASTSMSPVTSPRALPHIVGKSVTLPRPSGGGGGSTSSFTSNHGKTATDASVPSTSISDSSSSLKRESLLTRISSGITGIRNRVRSTSSLDGRKKDSLSRSQSLELEAGKKDEHDAQPEIARTAPIKSILKKSTSVLSVQPPSAENLTTTGHARESSLAAQMGRLAVGSTMQQRSGSAPDLTKGAVEMAAESSTLHAVHPSLAAIGGASAVPNSTQIGSLSKMGSSKKLSFQLDKSQVIHTYSKNEYNRKPPPNMTFHKLDNELRSKIREELNDFKLNEMQVIH